MKITLKCKRPTDFINFILKFRSFDSNVLIEFIDSERIQIKASTPSHSTAKYGTLEFNEIFDIVSGTMPNELRWAVFNIDKIKTIFNSLVTDSGELKFDIDYNEKEEPHYFSKITVSSTNIKFNIKCGENDLLEYIPDFKLENLFKEENLNFKLKLKKEDIAQILQLSGLDIDDNIKFSTMGKKLSFKGKSYVYAFTGDVETTQEKEISLTKSNLKYLDNDDYLLFSKETSAGDKNINVFIFTNSTNTFRLFIADVKSE